MKIQDIFNLPKNKGGAKLFQRIMNRYGIPKEDSKELKNNIDNSSSGGGSSRVEYYKILDITNLPIAIIVSSLFKGIRIETHEMTISTIYPIVEASINGSDYFDSIDALAFIPFGNKDAIFDGFKDAFYVLLPELNPSISKEELDLAFNASFIPITEEEFYNLN